MSDPILCEPWSSIADPRHLWNILNGNPYSCHYVPPQKHGIQFAYCRLTLRVIPDDMENYVITNMARGGRPLISYNEDGSLNWWWMRRSNDGKTWIEVCIRV